MARAGRGGTDGMCPPGRAKGPVRRSGELEHLSDPCSDSQLELPRDRESRGVGDRRQVQGADKAPATLTGQRIRWEVARADPLKIPRQALGEPEEMQQNSALNHSSAPSVVKPDPEQVARVAERSCGGRAPGETLHGLPKGRHTGRAGQASPVLPLPPARTGLDETLGLGDGAACRAVS